MLSQGNTELTLNRRGRKRKQDVVRDKTGKSRGEKPDAIVATALAPRVREHGSLAVIKDARTGAVRPNPLAGFTLGVLRLRNQADPADPSGISEEQFRAGNMWSEIVHRHAAIMGYEVKRSPASPSFIMVGGSSCAPDPDDRAIAAIRDRWRACDEALKEAARSYQVESYRPGWAILDICFQVCIENRPAHTLKPVDFGNLRVGLNALARVNR